MLMEPYLTGHIYQNIKPNIHHTRAYTSLTPSRKNTGPNHEKTESNRHSYECGNSAATTSDNHCKIVIVIIVPVIEIP